MSIVRTVPESEATGLTAELYAEDVEELGYIPSHTRVMALNPEAVRAFEALVRTVAVPLGKRRYELVTLAAARGIRSKHCLLAHANRSRALFDDAGLTLELIRPTAGEFQVLSATGSGC